LEIGLSRPSGPRPPSEAKPALDAALKALDLVQPPGPPGAARDFTVPRLGGGTFRLSEQRGKTVLVNFWASWCPPCLAEMPAMERLWRQLKDDSLVIVAVSLDPDPSIVPAFIEDRGVTFPVGLDPNMAVASIYGVRALPATFVIDRRGGLTALALGPRAWDTRAAHALVEALGR
jgi:peroxiredoxin